MFVLRVIDPRAGTPVKNFGADIIAKRPAFIADHQHVFALKPDGFGPIGLFKRVELFIESEFVAVAEWCERCRR